MIMNMMMMTTMNDDDDNEYDDNNDIRNLGRTADFSDFAVFLPEL